MDNKSNSFEAYEMNEKLRTLYGVHEETSKPRFRVVHSDDQLEKRFGTFEVFNGDIYLRTEVNVIREVPKYPYYWNNQWIVERLEPNTLPDVYEGDFVYNSLWSFPEGLPLDWEPVEFVVKKALDILPVEIAEKFKKLPQNKQEMEYEEKQRLASESKRILNMLDGTALQSQLHHGEAVSIPDMSKVIKES